MTKKQVRRFKRNLRRYRERAGLNQRDASRMVGRNDTYFSLLEGRSSSSLPTLKSLVEIAKALRVRPSAMLKGL